MTSLHIHRKGQAFNIASIGSIAIALLVVAVIIGLNSTILEKIKDTSDDNAVSNGNISLVWVANNTGIQLGTTNRLTGGGTVFNGTGVSNTIPNTLWAISNEGKNITFFNTTNQTWDTDNLVVNPGILIGSAARNASQFGIDGQTTMAEFIPTIAIIAIAAVLIGIVLLFFGRRRVAT